LGGACHHRNRSDYASRFEVVAARRRRISVLLSWYALARANEKNDESNSEIKTLLRSLASQAPLVSRIVEQNEFTHSLLRLNTLYHDEAASKGSTEVSLPKPSLSARREVTLTPGTGELMVEGHAPTITVEASDQKIRENEAVVFRLLAEDDAGAWVTAAQIAARQRNTQEAAIRTSVAVQMQNIVNSGGTEFPTAENSKPTEE
jgi:hypothetical protein